MCIDLFLLQRDGHGRDGHGEGVGVEVRLATRREGRRERWEGGRDKAREGRQGGRDSGKRGHREGSEGEIGRE